MRCSEVSIWTVICRIVLLNQRSDRKTDAIPFVLTHNDHNHSQRSRTDKELRIRSEHSVLEFIEMSVILVNYHKPIVRLSEDHFSATVRVSVSGREYHRNGYQRPFSALSELLLLFEVFYPKFLSILLLWHCLPSIFHSLISFGFFTSVNE